MTKLKLLVPVLLGVFGMFLGLLCWHVWIDHQTLHNLLNIEIAREQQAQKAGGS